MSTTHSAHDDAVELSSTLRRTLQAAGIYCPGTTVDDDKSAGHPVMHMNYLAGPDAATLAALLRPRPGADTALPARTCPESMTYEETVAVRNGLHDALAEAGISGLTQVSAHPRGGPPVMHLKRLDSTTATTLISLLRAGMSEHFATADALHDAFQDHGLYAHSPFPEPAVNGLRIRLGDVSVHSALALGTLLGAGPVPTELAQIPDYPESVQVMERLFQAVREKTSGFMDVTFHPNCMKCDHFPTITLGDLGMDTAKRLAEALQPAHEQP
ncbi:hypothetical protein [Streptomyces sp. NPDC006510]|uniref:hypothetical protein n=1 Tax=Streptomyces sp. NPDC006510 TaxID=3155600 RepID=UPI0033B0C52C